MSDTTVIMQSIPDCDVCKMSGEVKPAYADASLSLGSWGYVCIEHFNLYGKGLGLGRGQRLLLDESSASEKRVLFVEDEDDEDADPVVDTVFYSKEHEAAAKYVADLIAKRDKADATIPLSDAERTSWSKRIAKASVIMHTNAMAAKR